MERTVIVASIFFALAPAAALAQDGPFLKEEGPDLWRASKLVGVDVFGPGGGKVGDVREVLLDHDGRVADVVIGVGGFLGLGQKDVALPYAQVHFTQDPRPGAGTTSPAPAPAPGAALGGPVGTTTGVPGGRATGLAGTPAAPPGPTAGPARSSAWPDHATVDLSAEQLREAPAFAFAR